MVAGGAQRVGNPASSLQKEHVVPDVGVVVGVRRVDQAGVGGIASRAHAGRAVERIDFEAGVVGNDQFAGRETRVVDSLGGCIGEEGVAVFFGSRELLDAGKRFDVDRRKPVRRCGSRAVCRRWWWRRRGGGPWFECRRQERESEGACEAGSEGACEAGSDDKERGSRSEGAGSEGMREHAIDNAWRGFLRFFRLRNPSL